MKIRTLFIVVMVLTVLTACAAPAAPAVSQPSAQPLRIAVVMPSSIHDLAFSQSMYDALKAVQAEMGGESALELKYSENMFKVPDAAAAPVSYTHLTLPTN